MSTVATSLSPLAIPSFVMLSSELHDRLSNASNVILSTEVDSNDRMIHLVQKLPATEVTEGATIIIPLRGPLENEAVNYSYLGACTLMFCVLQGKPGTRTTFGTCVGYSSGDIIHPVEIGSLMKFLTPESFFIAKGLLMVAVQKFLREAENIAPKCGEKRQRQELLEDSGEQPDAAGERSLSYIVDLDGVRHSTRSKKDLAQREKDLVFGLRAIDKRRWPHLMGNDMLLQHVEYARVIDEQTQTRPSAREAAYQSCGIADRIGSLNIANDSEKLKLLFTGSAFTGIKKSLSLDDFEATGFPIALGREPDIDSNRNLSMALKNLQVTMTVYYSTAYAESFSGFLADLEGYSRPLELVTASYLHHSIEMTLSKFFRVIRTQKGTEDPSLSVNNPEKCAEYLVALLVLLSTDLSNHAERSRMEEYYLLRTRKEEVSGKKIKKEKGCPPKNVKFESDVKQDKVVAKDEVGASIKVVQVCASHLGNQIGAINERTKEIFVCPAGSKCRFSHPMVKDKSIKALEEMIAKMPYTMRPALSAAAKKKST